MSNRKIKTPQRAAEVLSKNVISRARERYKHASSVHGLMDSLRKESGVGRSTLQRIFDPGTYGFHGTTLDTMVKIAMALRCEVHELLMDPASEAIDDKSSSND